MSRAFLILSKSVFSIDPVGIDGDKSIVSYDDRSTSYKIFCNGKAKDVRESMGKVPLRDRNNYINSLIAMRGDGIACELIYQQAQ